jgi:hypothetical protein
MNPMISAELTRYRIADFHRAAQRDQLAQHARRMRRGQRATKNQTEPGRLASILTRHTLAVLSARSPAHRPMTARPHPDLRSNRHVIPPEKGDQPWAMRKPAAGQMTCRSALGRPDNRCLAMPPADPSGALPGVQALALLAAASQTKLAVSTGAVGGSGAFTARLLVTTDAGRHWTAAATETQQILQAGLPAWLGFETSQIGWWASAPHSVWSTRDGGLHRARTRFP